MSPTQGSQPDHGPRAQQLIRRIRESEKPEDAALNSEERKVQDQKGLYINPTDYAIKTFDITGGDVFHVVTFVDGIVLIPKEADRGGVTDEAR